MIFVEDLGNPEGPVLLSDHSWALVEMHPDRGWITHLSSDGKERRVIATTGRPNGLLVDSDGVLWVAESVNPPSLLRVTMDGHVERVLDNCDGEPFLFPNDLCFGSDGALYMTDSGILNSEWRKYEDRSKAPADGRIYRIDLSDRSIRKLDSGLAFANGIAFGPDDHLYVSTTQAAKVYRYRWNSDGSLGPREEFADLLDPEKSGFRGGDGMAFGQDGNLYCAVVGQGDVSVFAPDGSLVRRIQLQGPAPTNVAFGPQGSRKLYVTEQGVGRFEVYDVDTDGLPLHPGRES
ncbi:MAG: SMP-30/gluconolactonase/LRE family protein [Chloroflexota bacterium]